MSEYTTRRGASGLDLLLSTASRYTPRHVLHYEMQKKVYHMFHRGVTSRIEKIINKL
jgi:hypothetical protein